MVVAVTQMFACDPSSWWRRFLVDLRVALDLSSVKVDESMESLKSESKPFNAAVGLMRGVIHGRKLVNSRQGHSIPNITRR